MKRKRLHRRTVLPTGARIEQKGEGHFVRIISVLKSLCVTAVILFFAVVAHAEERPMAKEIKDVIKNEALTKLIMALGARIIGVNALPELNFDEVVFEQQGRKDIVYLTKDGQYIIFGSIIGKDIENITKKRLDELNRVQFSRIPLEDAIAIKKGSGSKKLVMITDVDCPFCRKAYEYLMTQNDLSLYVFLFPLDIHPRAFDKSIRVLCAKDKPGATVVTTNLSPKEWGSIFSGAAASAILDRLSFNGRFITFEGRSYRLARKQKPK